MDQRRGKFVRTTSCATVGIILVLTAGCSMLGSRHDDQPAAVAPQVAPAPAAAAMDQTPVDATPAVGLSDQGKPGVVNVFGEVDGKPQSNISEVRGEAGFQQHTFVDEGYDADESVDPSGKWLVFTSTRNSEHPGLYMQRVDGLSVVQLTDDNADYAYPTFSPDGKQIAFSSTRNGNWEIFVMDADGKNITQVTTGPGQKVHPSFSPDGGRLVYSALGRSGQWELWTVDLNTSEKRLIGFGLFPSWSPVKGTDRIAFQRSRERGERWFSLWTLDLVNGEARHVTEVAVSTNAAIVSPCWSADGKELAFATIADPSSSPGDKQHGQEDIWTINADGTDRHRLTDGVGMNLSPVWGVNGRVYFISDRGGSESVWSVNTNESVQAPKVADEKAKDADAVGTTGNN